MSLVHKIPPLVSALAFGYGVGMSAPESTITSMNAAVSAYQQGPASGVGLQAAVYPGAFGAPLTIGQSMTGQPIYVLAQAPAPGAAAASARPGAASLLAGGESQELSRLRELQAREGRDGASCDLDRPTHSRPPRYVSTQDRYADDVDELDAAGAEALSRLQLPDVPLAVTRRTLKYVRFFTRTDRGRGMFETWLKRSGKYQDMIQGELRERRLPEDLIWVAMIESGFDPRARSPAGAVGLWQFMPATGAVYGLQQSQHIDQRKNPRLATQAAAHHLRDLYLRFGNWDLALAAYNMGYEQLLDRIDQYGTSDFNELARQEAVPRETASYVPKIAAAAIVANNLERFGFEGVKVSRPIDAAEIAVPPRTPLKTLAKAAGVSTATLRTLNPDLLADRVPPGRGDFLVMIPADTLARAQAALPPLLDTEPLVADDASVLNPIDLLGGRDFRRRRVRSEEDSLLSLLPSPKRRRALRDPVASILDNDGGADDEPPARAPARGARSARKTMLYRVGPGDTLIGVARQFAIDVEDVARGNRIEPDTKLRAGALLKLRVRPELIELPVAGGDDKDAAKADARDAKKGARDEAKKDARDAKKSAGDAKQEARDAKKDAATRGASGRGPGRAAPRASDDAPRRPSKARPAADQGKDKRRTGRS